MSTSFLTIYIPTYNRFTYLYRLLSLIFPYIYSINEKKSSTLNVFISDNCSTDKTADILKYFKSEYISYHRNDCNIGPIPNFYQSVNLVDSQFLWVVGDDDLLLLQYLPFLIDKLQQLKPDYLFLPKVELSSNEPRVVSQSFLELSKNIPLEDLAHITRVIYSKSYLTRTDLTLNSIPSFYIWPWVYPAVVNSATINSYIFNMPVVWPTKDGGMDNWTGKTALPRLIEFLTYINKLSVSIEDKKKLVRLNFPPILLRKRFLSASLFSIDNSNLLLDFKKEICETIPDYRSYFRAGSFFLSLPCFLRNFIRNLLNFYRAKK